MNYWRIGLASSSVRQLDLFFRSPFVDDSSRIVGAFFK